MTELQFIETLQNKRGGLQNPKDVETMKFIFVNSCDEMLDFILSSKKLGIKRLEEIVSDLTMDEQKKFLLWLGTRRYKLPKEDYVYYIDNLK